MILGYHRPENVAGPFHNLKSGLGVLLKVYAGPVLVLVWLPNSLVQYWSVIPLKQRHFICHDQLSSNLNLVRYNTTINLPSFTP